MVSGYLLYIPFCMSFSLLAFHVSCFALDKRFLLKDTILYDQVPKHKIK